jgi:hypothetical protein
MRSVTHTTQVPISGPARARRHGGTTGAAAQSVGEPTVRMPVFADGRERKSDSRQTCANSSLMRSMPASHSRTVLRKLGLTSDQVWGLTKSDDDTDTKLGDYSCSRATSRGE